MRIISPSFEILTEIKEPMKALIRLEKIGRTCYKSESEFDELSAKDFCDMILHNQHESVIEHEYISVRIICDRGVSHEIVRHRLASYSQESTRYCNYSKGKFGGELTFIKPCFWDERSREYMQWVSILSSIENAYMSMVRTGSSPQEARSILPNSLKTEIVMTANLREWKHFFKLRTSKKAHPQMRELSVPMLEKFRELIPVIFEEI